VGEILETDLGKMGITVILVHIGVNSFLALRSETSILSLSKDAAQGADLRKPASFDKLRMLPSYRVIYAEVY
jgi:hypothetical protein